ncbi:hypothetical protein ACLB1O_29190 [Escherichia coli]
MVTNFTIWRWAILYLINGEARAHTRTLNVKQNYEEWFSFVGEQDLPLADLDADPDA